MVIQVRTRSAPNNLIFRPLVDCIRCAGHSHGTHNGHPVRDGGPVQDDQPPDHVVQLRDLHQPPLRISVGIQGQAAG